MMHDLDLESPEMIAARASSDLHFNTIQGSFKFVR